MRISRTTLLCSLALTAVFALSGCIGGVNGSVHVPSGSSRSSATTVNGSVFVGDDARIGDATTVNGSVRLGDNVTAKAVRTVNGSVKIGNATKVTGDVRTVNGGITLAPGADISGGLASVNGAVRLEGVHIGGEIEMVNGSLFVGAGSHVEGGIHVKMSRGNRPDVSYRRPRIVIGPGATVEGLLRFDREVKLYVSDRATIGPVEGATPIRFSGDHPSEVDGDTARASRWERRYASRGWPEELTRLTPSDSAREKKASGISGRDDRI